MAQSINNKYNPIGRLALPLADHLKVFQGTNTPIFEYTKSYLKKKIPGD